MNVQLWIEMCLYGHSLLWMKPTTMEREKGLRVIYDRVTLAKVELGNEEICLL